jgi:hypothetical protein
VEKEFDVLDKIINDIQEICKYNLTDKQLDEIRHQIATYALCCLIDSKEAKKAEKIACCEEQDS